MPVITIYSIALVPSETLAGTLNHRYDSLYFCPADYCISERVSYTIRVTL